MAKKKVKLADVLWDAANKHLRRMDTWGEEGSTFTCCAVDDALEQRLMTVRWSPDNGVRFYRQADAMEAASEQAMDFLKGLGCPVNSQSPNFRQPEGPLRQGVRYMWLLLAMHVAEDEGVVIEVEA